MAIYKTDPSKRNCLNDQSSLTTTSVRSRYQHKHLYIYIYTHMHTMQQVHRKGFWNLLSALSTFKHSQVPRSWVICWIWSWYTVVVHSGILWQPWEIQDGVCIRTLDLWQFRLTRFVCCFLTLIGNQIDAIHGGLWTGHFSKSSSQNAPFPIRFYNLACCGCMPPLQSPRFTAHSHNSFWFLICSTSHFWNMHPIF